MSMAQRFSPSSATHFDLIQQTLDLTDDELGLLAQNGFVISDRLNLDHFAAAYAYLHWKDLPVLITTDSLLHATHQGFDTMLQLAEEHLLSDSLQLALQKCRETATQMKAENDNASLTPLLDDLITYFSVPLALLEDTQSSLEEYFENHFDELDPEIIATTQDSIQNSPAPFDQYFQLLERLATDHKAAGLSAETARYVTAATQAAAVQTVNLFGGSREVDFSLFTPRGHYTNTFGLRRYFRAQTWLQQIDFRLVDVDMGQPILQTTHLAAATLLLTILERAEVKTILDQTEAFLTSVFGPSDNTTLSDFARFLDDAGIPDAVTALSPAKPDRPLRLLLSGVYGMQRITGQLQTAPANRPPVPRPVSLLLMGPRFIIDGLITSELVFDRLIVGGQKVNRPLPQPLDVLYTLGNDRALVHLETELAQYGYRDNLRHLRLVVAQEAEHRADTLYYAFLHAIRALNAPAQGEHAPTALRGEAWQDKMLQTQLAAWSALRRDSILYAKQAFDMGLGCSYPAGYVEPYPAFYTALADYAARGLALFLPLSGAAMMQRLRELCEDQDEIAKLDPATSAKTALEQTKLRLDITRLETLCGPDAPINEGTPEESEPTEWDEAVVDITMHFAELRDAALMLRGIAEKELAHQSCSDEEIQFLTDTIFYRPGKGLSGGPTEFWTGWYPRLFYRDGVTEPTACVADIHTKPSDQADPLARVLHIATGRTAMAVVLVDGLDEPTLYVGPAATYYEFVTAGEEPQRETDLTWRATLDQGRDLPVPSWTQRFRSSPQLLPAVLELPEEDPFQGPYFE
jgi:Protein of unknown function (DUF3160)